MPARPEKITFAEMRGSGIRGLLIYCSDFRCSHWTAISGDRWPDEARLSDVEPRFVCESLRPAMRECPAELPPAPRCMRRRLPNSAALVPIEPAATLRVQGRGEG
jgi:hypothetical protein